LASGPVFYGRLDLGWASDVRVFAIVGHRGVRSHIGFSASRVMVQSSGHGRRSVWITATTRPSGGVPGAVVSRTWNPGGSGGEGSGS
jgi:hypothetical protein